MNTIIKSKVLLFLIALAIPTIVFLIMAYMMAVLLKENTALAFQYYACTIIVTYLLVASAYHINSDAANVGIGNSLGNSLGLLIASAILGAFLVGILYDHHIPLDAESQFIITFIYGWALSVFTWTYNLFKKDAIGNGTNDNDDLIGGWYGVDSKLSCCPVLAFEKNYIATFSDGKIVKEYNYHVCCSTCIILTAKDGEKIFVKRIWIKHEPHLYYNEQEFTRSGKHK